MAWFPTATGHLGTACPPVHVMGNVGTTIAVEAWNNDPLLSNPALMNQQETEFLRYHAGFSEFFYTLVNRDHTLKVLYVSCLLCRGVFLN